MIIVDYTCVVYATSTKSCFERKAFLRVQLIENIFNSIFDVIQNIHNKAEDKLKLETRGKLFTIMSLFKVFQKLKSSAQKRPLLFNSMIYGSFYTGAEFAQQTYNKIFKFSLSPVSANIEETNTFEIKKPLSLWIRNFNQKLGLLDENNSAQSRSYNWAQLKRYAIYGCFIAGPILHGWYHVSLYLFIQRFMLFICFYHLSSITLCFLGYIVRHFMY